MELDTYEKVQEKKIGMRMEQKSRSKFLSTLRKVQDVNSVRQHHVPDIIHYSAASRVAYGAEISIQISALAGFEPRTSHLVVQHETARPQYTPTLRSCSSLCSRHLSLTPLSCHYTKRHISKGF